MKIGYSFQMLTCENSNSEEQVIKDYLRSIPLGPDNSFHLFVMLDSRKLAVRSPSSLFLRISLRKYLQVRVFPTLNYHADFV